MKTLRIQRSYYHSPRRAESEDMTIKQISSRTYQVHKYDQPPSQNEKNLALTLKRIEGISMIKSLKLLKYHSKEKISTIKEISQKRKGSEKGTRR